jgi:hypothetical protein
MQMFKKTVAARKREPVLMAPNLSDLLRATANRLDVETSELEFRPKGAGFHEARINYPDGSSTIVGPIFPPWCSPNEWYELWITHDA